LNIENQRVNSIASLQRYETARAKATASAPIAEEIAREAEDEPESEVSTDALRRYQDARYEEEL
jgi:hypothetical protein